MEREVQINLNFVNYNFTFVLEIRNLESSVAQGSEVVTLCLRMQNDDDEEEDEGIFT